MSAAPSSAASRPSITRIVVDLPAPFGPTKPVTWPGRTVKDIPSSATAGPNRLRSPATSIVASMVEKSKVRAGPGSSRARAVFRAPVPGVPNGPVLPRRATRRLPAAGDAAALRAGTINGMVPDWLARAVAARHAPAAGVALLAAAAFGQALAQFVVTAGQHATDGTVQAVFGPVPVCLLALAATVPLLFLRPAAAAITVAAANALLLAGFGEATVAGVLAQLIAAYRAGAAAEPGARWPGADWLRRVPGARRASVWARAGAPYSASCSAVPFLVLALAGRGGDAAVLLAWGGPAAAGAGIAVRARREARTRTAAGEALADTMLAHTARGERARIARELHDVVAHHISMVAVQAETARLTTPGLPAAGAHRFAEIGDTARAGLTEMRRLLGVLREDAADAGATVADRHPLPGLPQLAELVDAARDAVGGGHQADRVRPGDGVRPRRRARRLPDRAGGADQRAAARARRRRRRGAALRRRRAAAAGPRQRPGTRGSPETPGPSYARRTWRAAGTGCSGCGSGRSRWAARCGPGPRRAAGSSSRPCCRRNRRSPGCGLAIVTSGGGPVSEAASASSSPTTTRWCGPGSRRCSTPSRTSPCSAPRRTAPRRCWPARNSSPTWC